MGITWQHYFLRGCFFAGAAAFFTEEVVFFAGAVAFFAELVAFFAGAAAFFAATVALSACMIGSLAEVYSACCTAGAGASFCSVAVSFLPMVIVMYLMSSSSLLNQRSQK